MELVANGHCQRQHGRGHGACHPGGGAGAGWAPQTECLPEGGSSQYPQLLVQGGACPGDQQAGRHIHRGGHRERGNAAAESLAILDTSAVSSRPGSGTCDASEVDSISAISSEVIGCTTERSACGKTTAMMCRAASQAERGLDLAAGNGVDARAQVVRREGGADQRQVRITLGS
jgi:hypothetical protein